MFPPMPDLVVFTTADGGRLAVDPVYPAGSSSTGTEGFAHRGGPTETDAVKMVQHGIDDLINELQAPIGKLMAAFSHMAEGIDSVELDFSLGLTASAGAVISKIGGEANFSVKVVWKRDQPKEADTADT